MAERNTERLIEIVAGAAELPPGEREGYVRARLEHEADRVEAMSLLRSLGKAGGFMERPTLADAGNTKAWIGEGPGSVVGRYLLKEQIGEGGFGVVFRAEQTEPVRRDVALKVIKLGMDTRQVIARLEAERQALAMMEHPGIAKVLDAGATATGRPYFVMELVKGEPITFYCDNNSLSTEERLELFALVCQAVQHAHQKGIIHRDIKPSNVLVSITDGKPVPKVIDFGIAKATDARLTEKTLFTEQRAMLGTPEYMSPEQAESGRDIDTRSDIYSLGVLLYELLTGATPFDGAKLRSAAWGELQRIIREEEPPRPSTRLSTMKDGLANVAAQRRAAPGRLSGMIRGDLDWIVMRCLEKDRARRYDTADSLALDIRRHLAGEAVLAAPPGAAYRLRKFARRNRGAVISGTIILASLLAGLGTALWQARVATQARDEAVRSRKETERVAEFQASLLEQIDVEAMGRRLRDDMLAELRSGMERRGASASEIGADRQEFERLLGELNLTNVALKGLDASVFYRARPAIDEKFRDQPLVRARLLQTLATTMRSLGILEGAAGPQADALSLRRQSLGDNHADTISSMIQDGRLRSARGDLPGAEAALRDAAAWAGRLPTEDRRIAVQALNNLGETLQLEGKLGEAKPVYFEALDMGVRWLGPDDPDTIACRNNIGFMYYGLGNLAESGRTFAESLAASRRARGPDDEGTIAIMNNLASVYQAQDKLGEAETIFREALTSSRRARGDEHPATMMLESNMGHILYTAEKLQESEPFTRGALEKRRRVLGANHPDTLQSLHNLGLLLQDQKRLEEARACYEEVYERRQRLLGASHPATLQSMNSVATILQLTSDFDRAEPLFREALTIRRTTLGNDHPDTFQSMNNLAVFLVARGKPAEAEPLFREALAGREAKFGKQSPAAAGSRAKLGQLLAQLGKYSESESLLIESEKELDSAEIPKSRHEACIRWLAALYETWEKADPGKGHAEQAAAWNLRAGK